jgi:class 3 adenylate cyclase
MGVSRSNEMEICSAQQFKWRLVSVLVGQILASDVVKSSCKSNDLPFVQLGHIEMKGFEAPVEVYTINWTES